MLSFNVVFKGHVALLYQLARNVWIITITCGRFPFRLGAFPGASSRNGNQHIYKAYVL